MLLLLLQQPYHTGCISKFARSSAKAINGLCGLTLVCILLGSALRAGSTTHSIRWQRPEYARLSAAEAFDKLDPADRRLAYHLNRAAWVGAFITAAQISAESPALLLLVLKALQASKTNPNEALQKANFSEEEQDNFFDYGCGLFINIGNYREDTEQRFTAETIASDKVMVLIRNVWPSLDSDLAEDLVDLMLTKEPSHLGFPPGGQTQFWKGLDRDEAESLKRFIEANEIIAGNQLATKVSNSSGQFVELRFFSQEKDNASEKWPWHDLEVGRPWENFTSIVTRRGAYATYVDLVLREVNNALKWLTDDAPLRRTLELFADSLRSGDLSKHIDSGKAWVVEPDLNIDTYMGFSENYRDPLKLQLEYQSMVVLSDPVSSKMFRSLTERGAELIARMPWSDDFEQEQPWSRKSDADSEAVRPPTVSKAKSFTSTLVASFVSHYVPRGVNLPNYESVKKIGEKNFNLANAVMAKARLIRIAFLSADDADLLRRRYVDAFQIKLALHELLGHGSGVLFRVNKYGEANFNRSLIDPTTGAKIGHWYSPGQSFASKFGDLAAAFEETRANGIALYLACETDVLSIFDHHGADADEVCTAVFLNQVFTGLTSLRYYEAESGWIGDHGQADFVLLRVLMEELGSFVKLTDEGDEVRLDIDRSLIPSRTREALRDFVLRLQVYRSTGNSEAGRSLFKKYLHLDDDWLRLRDKVHASGAGIPDPAFVQGNIVAQSIGQTPVNKPTDDNPASFVWRDYEESCQGLLQSWTERFDANQIAAIEAAVEADTQLRT